MCGNDATCGRGCKARTPGPLIDADSGIVAQARGPAGQSGVSDLSPDLLRELEAKVGTCDFYRLLSDATPGDRESGYYWNYGYKYCARFRASPLNKNPKTARWIDCVMVNLQRAALRSCVHLGSLAQIKACAYGTHAKVYTDCGICEIDKTFITQFRVLFVPDVEDLWGRLGLLQVKDALRACIARPWAFDAVIGRYESWGDLDEGRLGADLAKMAVADPVKHYAAILGVMEMLSNTLDDDDVALEFTAALSTDELDGLAQSGDGRRILFMMKSAMEGGWVSAAERLQIERIGDRAAR